MGHLAAKVSNPHSPENLRKQEIKQAIGFTLGTAAAAAVQLGMIFGSMAHAGSIKEAQETPTEEISDENTVIDTKNDEESKKDLKDAISKTLKANSIEVTDEQLEDITKTYYSISLYDTDNGKEVYDEEGNLTDSYQQRILNYVKGKKFHNLQLNWSKNNSTDTDFEIDGIQLAVEQGDVEGQKQAFHAQARSFIEVYDAAHLGNSYHDGNGDGKIDVSEFVFREILDENKSLTQAEFDVAKEEGLNRVAALDLNADNVLDEDEISAYLWAMSKIKDGKNDKTAHDINFDEWTTSQNSLGLFSSLQATKEDRAKMKQAADLLSRKNMTYQNYIDTEDLSTKGFSETEVTLLNEAKELFLDNNFTQKMFDDYGRFQQALRNGYDRLK